MKELYGELSGIARFDISKRLFCAQILEVVDVEDHVLSMIDLINQLNALDFCMDADLQIDLILQLLPMSFFEFVMKFHMNMTLCTLSKLLDMLRKA